MQKQDNENWQPCAAGDFARLGARLGRARQRRIVLRSAGWAAAAAVVVIAATFLLPDRHNRDSRDIADISCEQVIALASAYKEGKLSPERRQQVTEHVMRCPYCREAYRKMGLISSSASQQSFIVAQLGF